MTFWAMFWVAVGSVLAFTLLFILLIIAGSRYSVSDTESDQVDFAGEIKEGHGGIPVFLWLAFLGMFIWTIVYFFQHWHEFAIITAYAS